MRIEVIKLEIYVNRQISIIQKKLFVEFLKNFLLVFFTKTNDCLLDV